MTGHSEHIEHVEQGCWCESYSARVARLDVLLPDRCQVPGDDGAPMAGAPACVLPAGHQQPCRYGLERPGDPCHYCGTPTDPQPGTKPGCVGCWTDLDRMTLADIKGLLAAGAPDLTVDPTGSGVQ